MEIVTKFDSENQHFLFSILAHYSIQIFGDNAWALRLPAVFFGTGSIIASYLVGREVTDIPEALLATALVAFSYHQIWFSQNARGYTGLLFWTLISSWFLIRGFKDNRTRLVAGLRRCRSLGHVHPPDHGIRHPGSVFVILVASLGYQTKFGRGESISRYSSVLVELEC